MKISTSVFLCLTFFTSLLTKAQNLLSPSSQQQFVNPLPVPAVINATGGGTYHISISQFQQQLGLTDPLTQQPL